MKALMLLALAALSISTTQAAEAVLTLGWEGKTSTTRATTPPREDGV